MIFLSLRENTIGSLALHKHYLEVILHSRADLELGQHIRKVCNLLPQSQMMFNDVLEILPEHVTCINVGAIVRRCAPYLLDLSY
jgi:hypothetical protein